MRLGDLLDRVVALVPLEGRETLSEAALGRRVAAVEYDSRRVVPDAIFFALRGQRADGITFAHQAMVRGASAIVAEQAAPDGWSGPWLRVADGRLALAAAAATFYRHPSEELLVVGVTGTNGKTTTTYLLAAILEEAGFKAGRVGTTGHRVGSIERDAARTTPEAPDLQRLLREMVDERCTACAMEVSSHALVLRRADFLRFSAGVFTNLTRDHLDFHHGMEEYFLAKRRLFEMLPEGTAAVVNADDPYGARLAAEFPRVVTFGLDHAADVACGPVTPSLAGLDLDVRTPAGSLRVRSALVGRPNASNVLAAVATAIALDLPAAAILRGVASVERVPGRFEMVSGPQDDVAVVVDYAHTDDALRTLLETARPIARGRLITVFGCGGDRDRTKRPLMGAVAARLSDLVVVTSDNPRSEDPEAIIDEIKKGLVPPDRPAVRGGTPVTAPPATGWLAIVDRRAAIERAVLEAHPGDLVIVAGKGHERSQIIGNRVQPFDDVEVARESLVTRRAGFARAGNGA